MRDLKIAVEVQPGAAIKQGLPRAGSVAWPLAGVLPLLTEEQRAWLGGHVAKSYDVDALCVECAGYRTSVYLDQEPTDALVAEALATVIEEGRSGEQQTLAEIEGRIQRALAAPDSDWISLAYVEPRLVVPYGASQSDERVRARLEALQPALREAIARKQAQREAEQQALEAERKAEQAERDALHAWGAARDETIRTGLSEGYDMIPAVTQKIGEAILEALDLDDDVEIIVEDTWAWTVRRYDRRRAPSSVALSTLVEARNRLDALRAALPDCLVLGDPQISRVTTGDGKYTAVTIHVHAQHDTLPEMIVEIGVES